MAVNTDIPAVFYSGNTTMAPYTPSGAVTAGWPVVIANMVGIPHHDIAANILGDIAISGGVYLCVGDAAIASGKDVWWDDTNKKVTETASGNKYIGYTVSACSADEGTCLVAHEISRLADAT